MKKKQTRRIEKKSNRALPFVLGVLAALLFVGAIELPLAYWFTRPKAAPVQPEGEETTASCDLSVPWYEQYSIVTHALGTVDGRSETNSKEAFLESYGRGARVFEADLSLTADGYLVVRHDFTSTSFWNLEQTMQENMFYADYMNAKIGYFYTPLDIDGLLALMKEHPDVYLITDTKSKEEDQVKEVLRRFSEALERAKDESLRERIIVQIYTAEMYDWVRDFVPEGNFIFTTYLIADRDYDAIGAFCAEHAIPVVTIDKSLVDEETLEILHGHGVRVYTHTVNKISDMFKLRFGSGADGFYSDCVTPSEWQTVLDSQNTDDADKLTYGAY